MNLQFLDKVVVVTGASKGIGASIALHFAQSGAAVVVNYASSKEGAARVVNEITKNGGQAIAIQADVSIQKDVERLFSETIKVFGQLDIVVNNAGVYEFVSFENVTLAQYHKTFDINVMGLFFVAQEACKHFKNAGCIINIGSIASSLNLPQGVVYNASKAAVDAITKTLGKELGPRNIRVNSINPGMIETEGTHTAGIINSEWGQQVEMHTSLGRIGQPQDIARAALFLASEDAAWITGEILVVSGGYY